MNVIKLSKNWNLNQTGNWVGGHFICNNLSNGYHGILRQWWDRYKPSPCSWLLIGEKNSIKPSFVEAYPNDQFSTMKFYSNADETDYVVDICSRNPINTPKFDLVVCQAVMEHVYDPFQAFINLKSITKESGCIFIHTHTPSFLYHSDPRDYIRFHHDWFEDLPKKISGLELLELFDHNGHIFSSYRKLY